MTATVSQIPAPADAMILYAKRWEKSCATEERAWLPIRSDIEGCVVQDDEDDDGE